MLFIQSFTGSKTSLLTVGAEASGTLSGEEDLTHGLEQAGACKWRLPRVSSVKGCGHDKGRESEAWLMCI